MSMISAQIDELREYADRADGTFPLLASALRDAADTIWQLRDDLQRTNAAVQDAEHDESVAWDRVRKAEAEADRLREQAARAWRLFTENGAVHPSDLSEVDAVRDGLRELGVEVDDG